MGSMVLNDITATFVSSNIYGIIGKNGSGKTMLFRAMSGLIKPSSGRIIIDDKDLNFKNNTSNKIGMIIENASLYPDFTAYENLMFLAKINKYIGKQQIIEALQRVGLDPNDKRCLKKYSLGMKQRVAIAQAIMEKPDFLFLDEPTNALDAEGIKLIHNIILEESQRGALILIASHNQEDIKSLCNATYHMEEGRLQEV